MQHAIEAEAKELEVLKEENLQTIKMVCPFIPGLPQAGLEEAENGGEWRAYAPQPGKGPSRTWRMNLGGVGALSRRLIAAERARALGRKPVDPRIGALERAASLLAEGSRQEEHVETVRTASRRG